MKEQERQDWKSRQEVKKKSIRSGILLIAVKTKSVNLTTWILVT